MMRKQGIFFWLSLLPCVIAAATDFSLGIDSPEIIANSCRERQCLNGLWRFYPLTGQDKVTDLSPQKGTGWGYFKVPGIWPQGAGKNSFQPMLPDETLLKQAEKWHTAWYRREFTVPAKAEGKKVFLDIEQIQTRGMVYIDGKKAGEILFPGGELELTRFIHPGKRQTLDIRLSAVPLSEDHYVVMDGNNITKVAARVKNKGIAGDVFLHIVPEERIDNTHFITKVSNGTITFDSGFSGLKSGKSYTVTAEIFDRHGKKVKTFTSTPFTSADLKNGRRSFSAEWKDPELWDLHTPQNLYKGVLTLSAGGKTLDRTIPERFGFREFGIDGQNYVLNGKVIHLRAYHLPNFSAFWMADKASRENSLEAYRRLRGLGFNFSISRNYNFAEGETNYLRGSFEAADEFGHLWSLSLPQPWQFQKKLAVKENADRFAAMSGHLIRKYWNHPSIVLYVTNHNNAGAWGDQNPLRIGGEYKRANAESEVKAKEPDRENFLIAQKRIAEIDPSRPTYSHASGSLGGQYSLNCYLNWAPKQERSDWLEHFSKQGKYPLSFVEWGLPHIASFSSYRWPKFIWAAKDVMTVWDAEYLAAEYGDSAAKWTPDREKLLDFLVRLGNNPTGWHPLSSRAGRLPEVIRICADYFADNLPAMRAWNIGILLPWDDYAFYVANPGKYPSVENPDRWKNLNKPGLVPDYFNWGDYMLNAHKNQFRLSALGEVLKIWNQPLIAWIGGEKVFTTKEHIFHPGDTVRKQLVVLNDARVPVTCEYVVWLRNVNAPAVRGSVTVEPGKRALVPFRTVLPKRLKDGRYELAAQFLFRGENIKKQFAHSIALDVIPKPASSVSGSEVALYDPRGMTAKLLDSLKIRYVKVNSATDLKRFKTLVIGREALSEKGPLPNLNAVRDGLNVLVFEQPTRVIERLGFRMNEYGLRNVFPRDMEHPVLNGLHAELLRDWRGEGTLLKPYLDYDQFFCPEWKWCGFQNTRVWRCRNRGVVANVQIEKPSVGNFTPILDGGFALQYAPLLEYREGKGRILFCQAEVTGRTETEPAANLLAANLLKYIRTVNAPVYSSFAVIGGEVFRKALEKRNLKGMTESPAAADVILVGPGAKGYPDLTEMVRAGKRVAAFGLSAEEIRRILPGVKAENVKAGASQIADLKAPELRGISNMDSYFQHRLDYAAVDGKEIAVLRIGKGSAVIVGVAPWMLDYNKFFRLRSSFRRRAFLMSQILRNAGIASESVLLEHFASEAQKEPWKNSYYLQDPISGDDPYRYYHW